MILGTYERLINPRGYKPACKFQLKKFGVIADISDQGVSCKKNDGFAANKVNNLAANRGTNYEK